jgi:hypothetical protein
MTPLLRITSAAFSTRSCKISIVSTGAEYASYFMYPHKKKSHVFKSGDRAGQATGPFRPIQRAGKLSCSQSRTICAL